MNKRNGLEGKETKEHSMGKVCEGKVMEGVRREERCSQLLDAPVTGCTLGGFGRCLTCSLMSVVDADSLVSLPGRRQ